jgi:5'-phosphate synthase pdxT subunit
VAGEAGPLVGVLAVQGDFEAHRRMLERAGARTRAVRLAHDLDGLDALVLPGGESTTMSKGMVRDGLIEPIAARIAAGMPVLGTCAGAILLAREVENHPVPTFAALDATATRNAYGTQVDSFVARVDPGAAAGLGALECVFIRAPRLERLGPAVEVLATVDGTPVLVRQRHVVAATFHPELTDDLRVHGLLIELIEQAGAPAARARASA